MNKKSMFFSVASILTILLLIINFKISEEKVLEENKIRSTQVRVKSLNAFVNDLENVYFERMLLTSSKKTLDALSKYASPPFTQEPFTQVHLDPTRNDFNTVFQFGYIEHGSTSETSGKETLCKEHGKKLESCAFYESRIYKKIDTLLGESIMQNHSFFELINKTENILASLGVRTKSFDISISPLRHINPWVIRVEATIKYHFEDFYETASWKGETTKQIDLEIYGFNDPKTGEIITRQWKVDRGLKDTCYPQFIGSPSAKCQYTEPSFLSRLQGKEYSVGEDDEFGICPSDPLDDCSNT